MNGARERSHSPRSHSPRDSINAISRPVRCLSNCALPCPELRIAMSMSSPVIAMHCHCHVQRYLGICRCCLQVCSLTAERKLVKVAEELVPPAAPAPRAALLLPARVLSCPRQTGGSSAVLQGSAGTTPCRIIYNTREPKPLRLEFASVPTVKPGTKAREFVACRHC